MRSGTFASLVSIVSLAACGTPSNNGMDATVATDGATLDATPDAVTPDSAPADASDAGPCPNWPPSTPWFTGTTCMLPACSTSASPSFDTSGSWTVTTSTRSTDCSTIFQAVDTRLQVGTVRTGGAHALGNSGTCDQETGDAGITQIGTFCGNTEVLCQTKPRILGVSEIDVGVLRYDNNGVGTGTITAYFSNLPAAAMQPGNACRVEFDVTVRRVTR